MKVGINKGDNIIFNQRGYLANSFNNSGSNYLKSGDATSTIAYWLAVLSTEYELLKQSNQNTDSTIYQIYCTLYTINRLDLEAEKVLNKCNQGSLNGFFIRDDIYENYVSQNFNHFNYYGNKGFMSKFTYPMQFLESTYRMTYELNNNQWNGDQLSFNSQDQIYALIYGLAFVRKFIPKNVVCKDANGNILYFQDGLTSLSDEAKAITARLVNYAREPYDCDNGQVCQGMQYIWHIARPNCVLHGTDVGADFGGGAFTYPLAESACMIDKKDWGNKNNGFHICAPTRCKSGTPPLQNCNGLYHNPGSLTWGFTLWNSLNSILLPNYTNINPIIEYSRMFSGLLMSICYCEYNIVASAFINNSKNKIDQLSRRTATTYYYHFPYSLALLHDLKVDVNESPSNESIIDLINEMNPCNHYDLGSNNWSSFRWSTDTRLEHLERIGTQQGDFLGEYSACDFLLYHNLWYLYSKKQNNNGINSYMTDLGDVLIDQNGNSVMAYDVDSYETTLIQKTDFILNSGSHRYIRAGKEIVFKPGTYIHSQKYNISHPTDPVYASVNSGLRAYIKGYDCSLDMGSYYPNVDSSYEYRVNINYSNFTDSVIKKITEEYPNQENYYHYVNYPEPESAQNSENENGELNQEMYENLSKYQMFKLYPIPAKEYLDIEIKGGNPEYFQVLDITGKEVRNYPIISPYFQRINLNRLPSGVYTGVIVYRDGIKDFIKFIVD